MKIMTFVTVIFHLVLLGLVFPYVVSSDRWEIFAVGGLALLVWVFWLINYVLKKFSTILKEMQ